MLQNRIRIDGSTTFWYQILLAQNGASIDVSDQEAPVADQPNNIDLLLRDYSEAGQLLRQHEALTRNSALVFIPTVLALAGYLFTKDLQPLIGLVLAAVGLAVSILGANVIRRHQLYYRCYVKRARAIEDEISKQHAYSLKVYTLGEDAAKGSCSISSKTAIIAFFWLVAAVFFVGAIVFGYKVYSG